MTELFGRTLAAAALIACVAAMLAPVAQAEAPKPLLKAGFAERDITPEIGMEQPGGYGKSFHRVLHDPCKVRAAVFDDGKKRVAIVGIDALTIREPSVAAARKGIQERCGIPPEAVLIAASHSHSSGPTCMVLPGEYDHASDLVKKLAYEQSSCADAKYLAHLEKQIVEAVCAADASRAEARCGFGKGIEDKVAFNRRFRMKNGLSYTHPGQGNPDIVGPAGPVDPEVGVIGAWNAKGDLIGCIVNFACHATCNPGGISANYIYYLEQVIRGAMGPDVVVVFVNGACGDVTQVDNLSPTVYPKPEQWSRLVGGRVGAEAVKVLLAVEPSSDVPLDAAAKVLEFKRRIPTPERVKKCLEMVQKDPKDVGPTEWIFAKEIVLLDALIAKHPTVQAEVQAIQVGPAVLITDPAEYFCQFGLDLKAGSPFPLTFPVELANGCVGYVPTEEALGPHGGGYETRLTAYSNLEPAAGRKMVEAGLELAKRMKPGPLPARPPHAPFQGAGWTYGNLPPELQ
jgi:neutral ceramidase